MPNRSAGAIRYPAKKERSRIVAGSPSSSIYRPNEAVAFSPLALWNSTPVGRTISSGKWLALSTRSTTLPNAQCWKPSRPCVAIMIMSQRPYTPAPAASSPRSATWIMVSATSSLSATDHVSPRLSLPTGHHAGVLRWTACIVSPYTVPVPAGAWCCPLSSRS